MVRNKISKQDRQLSKVIKNVVKTARRDRPTKQKQRDTEATFLITQSGTVNTPLNSGVSNVSAELTAFEGGATRTAKAERRELIPATAVTALARRLALGAAKHGVNNWRKGGPEFRLATVNHLLDHVFQYLEHGGRENTDAIICNAAFLCEYEERTPYEGVV